MDYTTCDRVEHRFEDVVMAYGRGHTVIVVGVKRLTDERRIWIARHLFQFSGGEPDVFDAAGREEQLRFARVHMGRHPSIDLTVYPDDTVSYSTRTSGGGGHDLATYVVLDTRGDIIPIGDNAS